jgi:hypothetical protein
MTFGGYENGKTYNRRRNIHDRYGGVAPIWIRRVKTAPGDAAQSL